MPQFKAGYLSDVVARVVADKRKEWNMDDSAQRDESLKLDGLLAYVSSFEAHFSQEDTQPDFEKLHPVLATLNNIITRGLPTRVPVAVEEKFTQAGITKQIENKLQYELTEPTLDYKTLFELLHIIEPGLTINRSEYAGNPESNLEWEFVNQHEFLKQILQPQRDFATISAEMKGGRRVDYCFTIPYYFWNQAIKATETRGHIFEVDGSQHNSVEYRYYDSYRDEKAAENGYETTRITAGEIKEHRSDFQKVFRLPYFQQLIDNFNRLLTPEIRQVYSLIFIPTAIARIHKTLVEYFIRHPNIFKKDVIRLAIVERDFPCGAMGMESLQAMFRNINELIAPEQQLLLPRIDLTICRDGNDWCISQEFECGTFQTNEEAFEAAEYDLVIDHSVLRRADIYRETTYAGKENTITVRSAHYADNTLGAARRTYCADLLAYKPLVTKRSDGSFEPINDHQNAITYFLQNIFRKPEFRPGQLPIIDRALRQLPVIGLLPTGGGKSIAYQLPALLQPGLCIVVDPIKSLMEDQVRVLRENNLIDCCDYINSNLHLIPGEMQKRLVRFNDGESHFLFVSPERFVIEDFRKKIRNIQSFVHGFALSFAYCVIDEVHCVSEWGHDFRTTYLMLGKNAQEYMAVRPPREKVSLMGLTATASFDVLADIERELHIAHGDVSDAIIMIENTIRPELFFRIIDVTGGDRCNALNIDFSAVGPNISKINNRHILEQSERHHFEEFEKGDFQSADGVGFVYNDRYLIDNEQLSDAGADKFSAIVFCPVKGTRRNTRGEYANQNGVCYVYENLNASESRGFYFGSGNMDEDGTENNDESFSTQVQQHFRDFLAGHTQHMVCTKAFGMGIDKENVRTTYHYFYSGSLESLVQECGRAGRDKKISEANILLSTATYFVLDVHRVFSENKDFPPLGFGGVKNRIAIRKHFSKKWNDETERFDEVRFPSLADAVANINDGPLSLSDREGNEYYHPSPEELTLLREKLLETDENGAYRYIKSKKEDRGIHDFFYRITFKGIETEKAQLRDLLYEPELEGVFADAFNQCDTDAFSFTLLGTKRTEDSSLIVCKLTAVNPAHINPRKGKSNVEVITNCFTYAVDFDDFMSLLGESGYGNLPQNELELHTLYHKDRKIGNDTGRLIYRMSCMGLLSGYEISYNLNNLHKCTFRKYNDIEAYLIHIEQYFRRYLSENAALGKIAELRTRLKDHNLIDNILECLFFLTEFSYREIAEKRKRAIDQIEEVMHNAAEKENWFEQNKYIKEEIYFYFNAKYARSGYSYDRYPLSLFDDYYINYRGNMADKLNAAEILTKYLKVYENDEAGPHQNKYKHMIGSCKKILRALLPDELKKEWVLRLLKAFAMFAVNNPSYVAEACAEVEAGFMNLYQDEEYKYNIAHTAKIFDMYFRQLGEHVRQENRSNNIIRTIRLQLLLELQQLEINTLTTKQSTLYS